MTLWGGRFSGKLDEQAWKLNASLPFDQRLALQDVKGSLAWAKALLKAGVLSSGEHSATVNGLKSIAEAFKNGHFVFGEGDEDIHTAVERRLGELIGETAGKLHTGRSRNDQVATDFRMWMLEALPELQNAIRGLQSVLVSVAEANESAVMPGYTHLQRAQPITLAHWLMSHFWSLQRDKERLTDLTKRVSVLPLGSGALAGTTLKIDREALAADLGFASASANSLDAVSDRDFATEYLFCAAMTGVHLSKLSEAVVLFSTAEFGFIELSDAFSTGSSLMPQKKNPDLFELARGKAGTLVGLLTGLLATLKGLPSTYDKDLQEDKLPVFQATDTLMSILPVLGGALETMSVKADKMLAAIDGSLYATDLADYLVHKGVPFRTAHGMVGKAVKLAAEKQSALDQLSVEEYQAIGPFEKDVYELFNPLASVNKHNVSGGTSQDAVKQQIQKAKSYLKGEIK
ncbi:MAG: argininosuccinate lyase [Anaerolineae bacterium]|nr:argininosuccinate lyase [Anaerolineae bacterium]